MFKWDESYAPATKFTWKASAPKSFFEYPTRLFTVFAPRRDGSLFLKKSVSCETLCKISKKDDFVRYSLKKRRSWTQSTNSQKCYTVCKIGVNLPTVTRFQHLLSPKARAWVNSRPARSSILIQALRNILVFDEIRTALRRQLNSEKRQLQKNSILRDSRQTQKLDVKRLYAKTSPRKSHKPGVKEALSQSHKSQWNVNFHTTKLTPDRTFLAKNTSSMLKWDDSYAPATKSPSDSPLLRPDNWKKTMDSSVVIISTHFWRLDKIRPIYHASLKYIKIWQDLRSDLDASRNWMSMMSELDVMWWCHEIRRIPRHAFGKNTCTMEESFSYQRRCI